MTWQAASEDRWLSRLTVTGEPGQPAGDSMRGTYRQKRAATWQGENRSLGLDFGELIEGTEEQLFSRISLQSIPDTLSALFDLTPEPDHRRAEVPPVDFLGLKAVPPPDRPKGQAVSARAVGTARTGSVSEGGTARTGSVSEGSDGE